MYHVLAGILCLISSFYTIVAQDNDITTDSTTTEEVLFEPQLMDYDWNVWCKFQPNGYACTKVGKPRFYYDTKMEDCKTFVYGGCPTKFNNFDTLSTCHEHCRDPGQKPIKENLTDNANCRLQPDFGDCNEYNPMWYYDVNMRICRGFSYSGCGGNNNKFIDAHHRDRILNEELRRRTKITDISLRISK